MSMIQNECNKTSLPTNYNVQNTTKYRREMKYKN